MTLKRPRWKFSPDSDGWWEARRYPAASEALIAATEFLADDLHSSKWLARFTEAWVEGAAIDPDFAGGCEGLDFDLVDSSVVRVSWHFNNYADTTLSLTDFKAMLEAMHQAMLKREDP
ncbi:hypothetical protein [Micromonospora pisi]|uniref:hypothetical protein n=1 Tax=Micromonospora pisi TaxID=589240 RepID=UPI0011C4810C|nr:hypothetical protein [Micromonospora pisi]